jgi:hypothetical protein
VIGYNQDGYIRLIPIQPSQLTSQPSRPLMSGSKKDVWELVMEDKRVKALAHGGCALDCA